MFASFSLFFSLFNSARWSTALTLVGFFLDFFRFFWRVPESKATSFPGTLLVDDVVVLFFLKADLSRPNLSKFVCPATPREAYKKKIRKRNSIRTPFQRVDRPPHRRKQLGKRKRKKSKKKGHFRSVPWRWHVRTGVGGSGRSISRIWWFIFGTETEGFVEKKRNR